MIQTLHTSFHPNLDLARPDQKRGTRLRKILFPLLALTMLLIGCAQAPDHSDPWLSFKYQSVCPDLKSCADLTDIGDGGEADQYYRAIGAEDANGNVIIQNFDQWKQTFGIAFNSPVQAIYANKLDLQLGRDMNCVEFPDTGRVVCYVTNYGPAPFDGGKDQENPNWPNLDQGVSDALGGDIHNSFATVAMVYDPNGIGTNGDKVAFYVFAQDPNDHGNQLLSRFAALDGEGGKTNPRMCMACHGGTYHEQDDTKNSPPQFHAHSVTGANFLPFDVQSFYYADAPHDLDSQQEAFRQLNKMVLDTHPNQPIQNLINGLYSNNVGTSGAAVPDDTFIPQDWKDSQLSKNLYKGLFRHYCRMCHVASTLSFESFASFPAAPVHAVVCGSHDMPHAEVPFGGLAGSQQGFGLWKDGAAIQDLKDFLQSKGEDPKDCK
jgi:hypothetical protein